MLHDVRVRLSRDLRNAGGLRPLQHHSDVHVYGEAKETQINAGLYPQRKSVVTGDRIGQ